MNTWKLGMNTNRINNAHGAIGSLTLRYIILLVGLLALGLATTRTASVHSAAYGNARTALDLIEVAEPGVWRLRGLAGKCFDVGDYPLGHSNPATLHDCNGSKGQDITFVPYGSKEDGFEYELRAYGRCLTVKDGFYQAGTPLILAPCDNSQSQRFLPATTVAGVNGGVIAPVAATDPLLLVTVSEGNSANSTPLVLETAQSLDTAQRWTATQFDTTAYDFAPVATTAGAYTFKGLGNMVMDLGGVVPYIYGPNGALSQKLTLRLVDEQRGYYSISAAGRCLDTGSSFVYAGKRLELHTCSGAETQRFAFDNFERDYIYPAGIPELVVGVVGASTGNGTPLELQLRAVLRRDQQNWQPVPTEHENAGPKAPDIRFDKVLVRDNRAGQDDEHYDPALIVRDNAALPASYEILWKPLGASAYSHRFLTSVSLGTGHLLTARIPELKGGVHVAKARATANNGLVSESPEIIIDGRQLEHPVISIQNVQDDEATVVWTAAGTPRVSHFDVRLLHTGDPDIEVEVAAKPGTGAANVSYQQRVTGLKPNTRYTVYVIARSDLWAGITSSSSVTTKAPLPPLGPITPAGTLTTLTPIKPSFTTSIFLSKQPIVQGFVPFLGKFGPFNTGAVISNINFPTQYPAMLLVKPGFSTNDCGNPNAVVLVHGDMTADQKKAIWGSATPTLAGGQALPFVGCSTSQTASLQPVNITWSQP